MNNIKVTLILKFKKLNINSGYLAYDFEKEARIQLDYDVLKLHKLLSRAFHHNNEIILQIHKEDEWLNFY